MAVSINWGGPLKRVQGLLERGLGLIEGRFRADPHKNMSDSIMGSLRQRVQGGRVPEATWGTQQMLWRVLGYSELAVA